MILTKEEVKAWMPIFQAFIEGKKLQRWNGFEFLDVDTSQVLIMRRNNYSYIRPEEYRVVEN